MGRKELEWRIEPATSSFRLRRHTRSCDTIASESLARCSNRRPGIMNMDKSPAFVWQIYINLALPPGSVNRLSVGAYSRNEISIELHNFRTSMPLNIYFSD